MSNSVIVTDSLTNFNLGVANTHEFLQAVIEAVDAPFYVWSLDGVLLLANQKWEDDTGIRRQEALGRSCTDLFPPQMANRFLEVNRRVIETGTSVQAEEFVDEPDGRHLYLTLKFPLKDPSGRTVAVGGISIEKKGQ